MWKALISVSMVWWVAGCTEVGDRMYLLERAQECTVRDSLWATDIDWAPEGVSDAACETEQACTSNDECGEGTFCRTSDGICVVNACTGGDGCCPSSCRPGNAPEPGLESLIDPDCGVRDILDEMTCLNCHSGREGRVFADLDFDVLPDALPAGAVSDAAGLAVIVPCEPDRSTLMPKIADACPVTFGSSMPPSGRVEQTDVRLIQQWIAEGASQGVDCSAPDGN